MPAPSEYSTTRRGIPDMPAECIGRKATLNPITISQKLTLAEALRDHAPGHLREPVVDAGGEAERHAPEEHVVHVRHDEVGVR